MGTEIRRPTTTAHWSSVCAAARYGTDMEPTWEGAAAPPLVRVAIGSGAGWPAAVGVGVGAGEVQGEGTGANGFSALASTETGEI